MDITIQIHPKYKNYGADEHGNVYSFVFEKRTMKFDTINTGYYRLNLRHNMKNKKVLVHRFVFECFAGRVLKKKECLDHIDQDKTHNFIANLRIATHSQNGYNRKKCSTKKSSKYKGVSWNTKKQKWIVFIKSSYRSIYGGQFDNEIDAAKKYNLLAIIYADGFYELNEIA